MLANENKQHRKKAVEKILRIRQNQPVNAVRKFLVPAINLKASDYSEMIEWNDDFTVPPLTKDISNDNLKNFIVNFSEDNPIFKFPCHNQAVERHVKLVTE